ncbi:M23 family metallopeptidase [Labedella endophytica]|uniref:M23ase beta-sheet core domain-containing protein n=1 Tax=Labedella endophytica TaxID=1523160 RepID=A0A3S0XA03_9MICO|nr:peptidoglycan DD-metalloendopeptidase family protein [Labedella endophytica]RUR03385.1 hypothetical protein ELQ94_02235 [Labedella endophytica]
MPASLPGDDAPLRRSRQRRSSAADRVDVTVPTNESTLESTTAETTTARVAETHTIADTAPAAASRSERRSRRIAEATAVASSTTAQTASGRRARRATEPGEAPTETPGDLVSDWMGAQSPDAVTPPSAAGRRARRVQVAAEAPASPSSDITLGTRRSRRSERPSVAADESAPLLTLEPRVTLQSAPIAANPSDLVVATESEHVGPAFSIVQDDPTDVAEHNAIPDEREAVSVLIDDVAVETVLASVSPSVVLDPAEAVAASIPDPLVSVPVSVATTTTVTADAHLTEQAERPVFVPRTVLDAPVAAPGPIMASAAVSASARRRRAGRVAAKSFSFAAFSVAGLLTLATSLPANALLSADDVAAQKVLVTQGETGSTGQTQTVAASGETALETVQRDTYGAVSAIDAAKALGIQPEATFTNDPNGTIQWPFAVGVHIGSGYGARPGCPIGCSTNHKGQDFNPGYGAPIQSIADGVVVQSTDSGGAFGVKIVIEHVIDGQIIHSLYGHMIQGSRTVQVGDPVTVGQVIGQTGNTGRSTGAHLHFEILLNGTDNVDPLAWLYANTN